MLLEYTAYYIYIISNPNNYATVIIYTGHVDLDMPIYFSLVLNMCHNQFTDFTCLRKRLISLSKQRSPSSTKNKSQLCINLVSTHPPPYKYGMTGLKFYTKNRTRNNYLSNIKLPSCGNSLTQSLPVPVCLKSLKAVS